jgi:hypothetical protein
MEEQPVEAPTSSGQKLERTATAPGREVDRLKTVVKETV